MRTSLDTPHRIDSKYNNAAGASFDDAIEDNAATLMNIDSEPVSEESDARLLSYLIELREELCEKHRIAAEHHSLVFTSPPTSSSVPLALQPQHRGQSEVNHGEFALKYHDTANTLLLLHEEWLLSVFLRVEEYKEHPGETVSIQSATLLGDIESALEDIENWKMVEWEKQRSDIVAHSDTRDLLAETASMSTIATGMLADLWMLQVD